MVSRYRQLALIIGKWQAEGLCALFFALLAGLAGATETPLPLRSYIAEYKTTARGFDLSITRKLEADANGHFILTNGGKILVVGFHEISVFRVAAGRVLPISYIYQGIGLVSRRQELHFIPEQDKITSLYKDQWYELPYSVDTLDRMSQVEQVRLALLTDPGAARDISLRVADGKRVKDTRVVLIGEETVDTALGPVETLHYERLHSTAARKSDLWFAPAWDYLMVKTIHVEDGERVEMTITSAAIDGVPVVP